MKLEKEKIPEKLKDFYTSEGVWFPIVDELNHNKIYRWEYFDKADFNEDLTNVILKSRYNPESLKKEIKAKLRSRQKLKPKETVGDIFLSDIAAVFAIRRGFDKFPVTEFDKRDKMENWNEIFLPNTPRTIFGEPKVEIYQKFKELFRNNAPMTADQMMLKVAVTVYAFHDEAEKTKVYTYLDTIVFNYYVQPVSKEIVDYLRNTVRHYQFTIDDKDFPHLKGYHKVIKARAFEFDDIGRNPNMAKELIKELKMVSIPVKCVWDGTSFWWNIPVRDLSEIEYIRKWLEGRKQYSQYGYGLEIGQPTEPTPLLDYLAQAQEYSEMTPEDLLKQVANFF